MFVDLRTCVLALCNYQSGGLWKNLRLMLFTVANLPDMLSLEELCLDVIIIFFPTSWGLHTKNTCQFGKPGHFTLSV